LEAIIYIVEGEGYTTVEDTRYDWKKGDTIFVPPMLWHEHVNNSQDKPAVYLAVASYPLMEALGMYRAELKGKKE
jgi:gentisate 1,2-dioxygenase